jgi:hypothetical protein
MPQVIRTSDSRLVHVPVEIRALYPALVPVESKLLLESNTPRQPVVEWTKRLKSQQMLDIFASPETQRNPDCMRI